MAKIINPETIINPCDICESDACDRCDCGMNEFIYHPTVAKKETVEAFGYVETDQLEAYKENHRIDVWSKAMLNGSTMPHTPVYPHPTPLRELSDEQFNGIMQHYGVETNRQAVRAARAIEAHLKGKA